MTKTKIKDIFTIIGLGSLGLCLILACSFRLYIEQFKENQVNFEEDMLFNMGQLLSFPFIALGIFLFFGFHRKLFPTIKINE